MRSFLTALALAPLTICPAAATAGIAIPEPTSLALLGIAATGVIAAVRLRRRT